MRAPAREEQAAGCRRAMPGMASSRHGGEDGFETNAPTKIVLSAKTGMPVGVLGRAGASDATDDNELGAVDERGRLMMICWG